MRFLSALSGLGLENVGIFNLQVPNLFGELFSALKKVYNSFSDTLKKFSLAETFEVKENWTYHTDQEYGLEVLKVETDSMALRKTRNALKDLFY